MPLLYSHSSKHSKVVRGPYVAAIQDLIGGNRSGHGPSRFQTFSVSTDREGALSVKVFMGVVDLKTCLVQIAYYRRTSCSTAFVSIDVNVKHLVHDLPVAIHF
jgi:hypothetical protein